MTELLVRNWFKDKPAHHIHHGNLLYEKQTDQIFIWIEKSNYNQVTTIITDLIKNCSLTLKRIIFTILEPLLHRDYIYHKFDTNSDSSFCSVSTFISRELRIKHEKDINRQHRRKIKNLHRLKSAHMATQDDVVRWSEDSVSPSMKLPPTSPNKSNNSKNNSQKNIPLQRSTFQLKSNKPPSYNIWVNPVRTTNLDNYEERTSLPQVLPRKTKSSNSKLFQCPARSTYLQRSRTQELPLVRTAPAKISKNESSTEIVPAEIFKEFPLSLKTTKRHLQTKKSQTCSNTGYKMRNAISLPNVHQISPSLQPAKRCLDGLLLSPCSGVVGGSRPLFSLDHVPKALPFLNSLPACKGKTSIKFQQQLETMLKWFSTWTNKQQEDFINTFLKLLLPSQLYFMYALLGVRLYCNFISMLPESVSLKIFCYLKPRDLVSCSKVCKEWKIISTADTLWRFICKRKKIDVSSMFPANRLYKDIYFHHKSIKHNWTDGKYFTQELHKHNNSVTSVHFYGDLLATGSADKTIRIWKMSQKKCIAVLEGHQKVIWSVKFISSILLCSCSNDQSIKIWNLRSNSCMRTLLAHDGAIWCLHVNGALLASGSADKTVKLWNLRSCGLIYSFNGHNGGVYSVVISDDAKKIFAGSIDQVVWVWDINMKVCIASFQVAGQNTPMAHVTSLSYDKGFLLCACGTDYQIWDTVKYKQIIKVNQAHLDRIECLQLKMLKERKEIDDKDPDEAYKGRVVTAGKDGKVKIWNLQRSKSLYCMNLSEEAVNSIQFDNLKLVCALQDSTIKIFNFS